MRFQGPGALRISSFTGFTGQSAKAAKAIEALLPGEVLAPTACSR